MEVGGDHRVPARLEGAAPRTAALADATSMRVAMAPPCRFPVLPNASGRTGMRTTDRPSPRSTNSNPSKAWSGVWWNRSWSTSSSASDRSVTPGDATSSFSTPQASESDAPRVENRLSAEEDGEGGGARKVMPVM